MINNLKPELAVIPPQPQLIICIKTYCLRPNGDVYSFIEKSPNNDRDASRIQFPETAFAYLFFDTKPPGSRDGPRYNISVIFGLDHQKICDWFEREKFDAAARLQLKLFHDQMIFR